MKTNKLELDNVVEVTYWNKNDDTHSFLTAIVQVPEESLPPMSEQDKKCGGRLLKVYFDKAAEILNNQIGPITVYESRFMGDMIVVH